MTSRTPSSTPAWRSPWSSPTTSTTTASPLRRTPRAAHRLLSGNFPQSRFLAPRAAQQLLDRVTRSTELASVGPDGAHGDGNSAGPSLSVDARHVAFTSDASNLVPVDSTGNRDIFVRDRGPVTGVGGLDAQRVPGGVTVSGWATLSGAVVTSGKDGVGDAAPGADTVGADLTGASVIFRPEEEDLLVNLQLTSLPGVSA